MKDRIQFIIKSESMTNLQFAQIVEISPAAVTHLLSGRNNPSLDMVCKIARRFPHYNLRWLILGEGDVYAEATANINTYHSNNELPENRASSSEVPPSGDRRYSESNKQTSVEEATLFDAELQSTQLPQAALSSSVSITETCNAPSPKLIVCLPDGTYQEYTKSN